MFLSDILKVMIPSRLDIRKEGLVMANSQDPVKYITSIKKNRATGEIVVCFDNINHSKGNRSSQRGHRPKSWYKTPEDINRMYNNAVDCLANNFYADNLNNTWYCVYTIADPHIKNVNVARKWIHEFEQSLSHKVMILAFIELNAQHHPHVHALITTKERSSKSLLTKEELLAKWKHGKCNKVEQCPNNLKRILNYSIKTYTLDRSTIYTQFDISKALFYQGIVKRCKSYMAYLKKKRELDLSKSQKQLLRKKFGIIIHHLKRTKADLKRELQKQYKVEDNPLYMTYGRQHSISVSIDNLTEEKLQDYLKNAEYLGSKDYTIRSSDASLIELFIKKDYYKKS